MDEIVENNTETQRKTFRKSLKKYFLDYCDVSTIQGLSYLTKIKSIYEGLWWIIILTICVGGCSIMIYQIFENWITTPVLFSLGTSETPIHKIPFPAVTICPQTKMSTKCLNYSKILLARRKNQLKNTTFTENKYFDYMALLCRSENYEGSMLLGNRSITEMFGENSSGIENDTYPMDFVVPDYSDFLYDCTSVRLNDSMCQWMGATMPCEKLMSPVITEEGLCYTFNMLDVRDIYSDINQMKYFAEQKKPTWDPDWGYPKHLVTEGYPRRAFLNGAKHAFVAVFLTKKSEIDFGCKDFSLQGMRVSLHTPSRMPQPSQVFFAVGLNRLTLAAVAPTLTYVTRNIKHYEPHKRNCYFSFERKLKYFRRYSQGNCNVECFTNFTIQYCNCVSFYMPRDNKTRVCTLQERKCLSRARVEYPRVILTQRLWPNGKNNEDVTESSICDCLPICSETKYNAEIAAGAWDFNNIDEAFFDGQREFINDYYASAVKVYFKSKYFLPTQKDELYGIPDLISDFGGILGLFTGFSLFSVAEIIYYLSIRLFENHRRFGYILGWTEG